MRITQPQLIKAISCSAATAAAWLPHLNAAMAKYGINTTTRAAHFLAQCNVESAGLTRLEENLNYSAERLMVVWPNRFKTIDIAQQFARNPKAIAEKVYGSGRMGNDQAGDGWRFRGRGIKQLTGRYNYTMYAEASGLDCINDPDVLLTPYGASDSAAWFWQTNRCNALADAGDVQALTRRINGGLTGLAQRQAATVQALKALTEA